MIKDFYEFIFGNKDVPFERHLNYGAYFTELGYECMPPYSKKEEAKKELLAFYLDPRPQKKENGFETLTSVNDMCNVCSREVIEGSQGATELSFAASIITVDFGMLQVGYVALIKTAHKYRR
jgi:hypothetical protein